MSAIYQDQEFVITEQDLAQVEQELNPADDFQSLIIAPLEAREDDLYSELEVYLLTLESRWEEAATTKFPDELFTRKEFTEEQMEAMWDESYRYGSETEETQNEYL